MFTPKHEKMLTACYKSPSNISILIHHIHLKPRRLEKVMKCLKRKTKNELNTFNMCSKSSNILKSLIRDFEVVMIEEYLYKIIKTMIKHSIRSGVDHGVCEVLPSVNKTFRGESGMMKVFQTVCRGLLMIMTNRKKDSNLNRKKDIMNIKTDAKKNVNGKYNDNNIKKDSVRNIEMIIERGNMDYNDDSSSSSIFNIEIQNMNTEIILLEILRKLCHIKDAFNNDFDVKFFELIRVLVINEKSYDSDRYNKEEIEIVSSKRNEILFDVITSLNIVNVKKFCYIFAWFAGRNCVGEIKGLKREFHYFVMIGVNNCLAEFVDDIKKDTKRIKESKDINMENIAINEESKEAEPIEKYRKDLAQEIKKCVYSNSPTSTLLNLAIPFISYTHSTETCLSFYELIEATKDKPIIYYFRIFLSHSKNDTFYIYLKKINSNIDINNKKFLLNEFKIHIEHHKFHLDMKITAMLINIAGPYRELSDLCYQIICESSFDDINIFPLLCKMRSVYYNTKNIIALDIIKKIVLIYSYDKKFDKSKIGKNKEKEIVVRELIETINFLVHTLGKEEAQKFILNSQVDELMIIFRSQLNDKYVYDDERDKNVYEENYGTIQRLYSHSMKSSVNLDNIVGKRKSRLNIHKLFK